jgi:preprotein translocase subunit Sss1
MVRKIWKVHQQHLQEIYKCKQVISLLSKPDFEHFLESKNQNASAHGDPL